MPATTNPATTNIDRARQLHWAGDLVAATDAYADILLQRADVGAGLTGLTLIAERMGDRTGARDLFGLLSQYPISPATIAWVAAYFDHVGQPDRALACRLSMGRAPAEFRHAAGPAADGGQRLLVVCPNFIGGAGDIAMVDLWRWAMSRFNPKTDWLMIFDGPMPPGREMGGLTVAPQMLADDDAITLRPPHTVACYATNIGHLHATGRDGWGRSLSAGLKAALAGGYDWVAHVEADMLIRADLASVVAHIVGRNGRWGAPRCRPWGFIESGLFVVSTRHLAASRFLERYDWRKTPFLPHQEWLFEAILGPCVDLPLPGGRIADLGADDAAHYSYVTKCRDIAHFKSYLDVWARGAPVLL